MFFCGKPAKFQHFETVSVIVVVTGQIKLAANSFFEVCMLQECLGITCVYIISPLSVPCYHTFFPCSLISGHASTAMSLVLVSCFGIQFSRQLCVLDVQSLHTNTVLNCS